jgi:hypothetical protein
MPSTHAVSSSAAEAESPVRRDISTPVFVSLDDAPVVLLIEEIASIYRKRVSTIRKDCGDGTFRPAPFATRPYRWLKDDVVADIARRAAVTQEEMRKREKKFIARPKRRRRAKS